MFLQKAMKQGRNVHSISHVMHAHKGCGHLVWVTWLLRFCVHPTCITRSKIWLLSSSCIWPIMKKLRFTYNAVLIINSDSNWLILVGPLLVNSIKLCCNTMWSETWVRKQKRSRHVPHTMWPHPLWACITWEILWTFLPCFIAFCRNIPTHHNF